MTSVRTQNREPGTGRARSATPQAASSIICDVLSAAAAQLRAAGVEDARLEAELLLCHALGCTRERLFARLREPLAPDKRREYETLLERRLAHEPLAYITERCEFYGLALECSPAALIPRPETELAVELALGRVEGQGPGAKSLTIVDVGTGSGAIAVTIAVHAPSVRVIAVDISRDALLLARRNAEAYGVAGRIDFVQGSLLSMLRRPVDVIVANLPYVPTHLYRKLLPELLDHEPEGALHAGRRGTAVIEELLTQAPALLRSGRVLLAEHQWDQSASLQVVARAAFPQARIETKRDLAGKERLLFVGSA
jgi:release factor glutamine methyltransferase